MNSQMLSNSINDFLKRGGQINVLRERRRYFKTTPKKYPEPSQIKENSIVKRIWFMGKVYLRRLN